MTRCKEWYEMLEKKGWAWAEQCGVNRKTYERAVKYWREYRKPIEEQLEKREGYEPTPILSEWAWLKQQWAKNREQKPATIYTNLSTEEQIQDMFERFIKTCIKIGIGYNEMIERLRRTAMLEHMED